MFQGVVLEAVSSYSSPQLTYFCILSKTDCFPTRSDDSTGYFGVGSDDLNPFTPPGERNPGHMGGFGGGSLIGPQHPGFGPNVSDPYRGGDPFGAFPQSGGRGGGRGRGAPPPGPRFDPFGPPINPKGDPDNDELPPPGGFGDNMYM